jgi:hypothetical protein
MPLLTAADVRRHVETEIGDAALQTVIDRLDAELAQRAGPHSGPIVETLAGGWPSVFLRRPIETVTRVREGARIEPGTAALRADEDYRVWPAQGRIERLSPGAVLGAPPPGGDGPRFAPLVEVSYEPVDDREQRRRVLLELVRLDLAQSGRASESAGEDYRYASLDYASHREALLAEARPFLTLE